MNEDKELENIDKDSSHVINLTLFQADRFRIKYATAWQAARVNKKLLNSVQ